jgi:hypothetical protein
MAKYRRAREGPDGWSDWIHPKTDGYELACCDCGSVHTMEFQVAKILNEHSDGLIRVQMLPREQYTVLLRAKRNNRATAQMRRHMKKSEK